MITESQILIKESKKKQRKELSVKERKKKQQKELSVNRELCDWMNSLSTKDLLEYTTEDRKQSESRTSLKGLCANHTHPQPTTARPRKEIPGTAHGCLFRDHRNIHGSFLLRKRQFGPSGEKVLDSDAGRIKVPTADDCAKACSLEEECDTFVFSSFQPNPPKDCILVKDGGVHFQMGCWPLGKFGMPFGSADWHRFECNTTAGHCPKKQGKKNLEEKLGLDEYQFVFPDEADFVCDALCQLVKRCTSWKFQILENHNNCKLLFTTLPPDN